MLALTLYHCRNPWGGVNKHTILHIRKQVPSINYLIQKVLFNWVNHVPIRRQRHGILVGSICTKWLWFFWDPLLNNHTWFRLITLSKINPIFHWVNDFNFSGMSLHLQQMHVSVMKVKWLIFLGGGEGRYIIANCCYNSNKNNMDWKTWCDLSPTTEGRHYRHRLSPWQKRGYIHI